MKKILSAVLMSAYVLGASGANAQSTDYYSCINASNKQDDDYVKCYLEEAKRDVAKTDTYYQKMSSNTKFSTWNNGNGMFKGNFKDMLDTWINFRNRYCSLFAQTYSEYDGSSVAYHQAECIMQLTKRHAEDMEGLWQTSVSKIYNE